MIKLKQNTKIYGDSTSGYLVILDKEYTINNFINEILTRKEWGYFFINDNKYKYQNDKLINVIEKEILSTKIKNISASGGWSRMDYIINTNN